MRALPTCTVLLLLLGAAASSGCGPASAPADEHARPDRAATNQEVRDGSHGDGPAEIVRKSSVIVAVKNRGGRPVQTYSASVHRFFAENFDHSVAPILSVVQAHSKVGRVEISDIAAGQYVIRIEADGYVTKSSKPFAIRMRSRDTVCVEVTLSEVGGLFGVVVDSHLNPVAGASVETLSVGFLEHRPVLCGFDPPTPFTKREVTTDSEGRFHLERLTPCAYQLRVEHVDSPRSYFKPYDVVAGEKNDIGQLVLVAGVSIKGRCHVGAGTRAEIRIHRIRELDGGPSKTAVSEKAIANHKGHWAIERRVHEGIYEVSGARIDLANPLMKIVDIHKSKREVRIVRGMPALRITIPN